MVEDVLNGTETQLLMLFTTHEKSKIPFSYMLYAYSVKEPIGELNLKRALDEDTGVFFFFFSLLSSSSPHMTD